MKNGRLEEVCAAMSTMFSSIPFGQFVPRDSFIHALDARVKIVAVLILMTLLFVANGWGYVIIAGVVGVTLYASKISPTSFWRGLRGILLLLVFTALFHIFLTPGELLAQFGPLKISKEGSIGALTMSVRLLLLVVTAMMLMLTTSPIELTHALESMMAPLQRFRFPAHELAMMMTIALRFIPTLAEEADKISKAQMSRGAQFGSGNVMQRARSLLPLMVPLFVSAFRRAEELALAMEARAYRGGQGRTRMVELRFGWRDAVALAALVLVVVAVWGVR